MLSETFFFICYYTGRYKTADFLSALRMYAIWLISYEIEYASEYFTEEIKEQHVAYCFLSVPQNNFTLQVWKPIAKPERLTFSSPSGNKIGLLRKLFPFRRFMTSIRRKHRKGVRLLDCIFREDSTWKRDLLLRLISPKIKPEIGCEGARKSVWNWASRSRYVHNARSVSIS